MEHMDALVEVVHEALVSTWDYEKDEAGADIPGTGAPWLSTHNLKTRENLIRTLVWYFEHFNPDPAEIFTLSNGKPAVEYTFKINVTDSLIFSGHLDRVVIFGGETFVMDQKTTSSSFGPYYSARFNPDTQMSNYTFAAKMIFGSPISGVLIDAAQVAAGFSRFERFPTHRGPDGLNEWLDDMLRLIDQMHQYTKAGYFPMNRASCHKYSGCEFRDICNRPPSLRRNFLEANFTKREWNPLRSR
jgi:hypothetical protein